VIVIPAMFHTKCHHIPQEAIGYKSELADNFFLDALRFVVPLVLICELGIYLCVKLIVLHTASASGCGVQLQLVIVRNNCGKSSFTLVYYRQRLRLG